MMKNLFNYLYHAGINQDLENQIYENIEQSNKKSVIAYSIISTIAFLGILLFSVTSDNIVTKNKVFYIAGSIFMIIMFLLNQYGEKKFHHLATLTSYIFIAIALAIGILLAISSKDDVTASFMVFLVVAPILFTLRPIYVILIILSSDILYIFIMRQIQTPELFHKNLVNAVIYGLISCFISTASIRMRIQKFETEQKNRILMETDQLTGMANRRCFVQYMDQFMEVGCVKDLKALVLDVNGLKRVNDQLGHHVGDQLLCDAASCIEDIFSKYGNCYRVSGDEFIAILSGDIPDEQELIHLLESKANTYSYQNGFKLSISAGFATGTDEDTITSLIKKADFKMYQNKADYYKRNGIDRRKH